MKTPNALPNPNHSGLPQALAALLAGLLLTLFPHPARAALIAYWAFDEGTGTLAADTSGNPNNHDGTLGRGGTGALPEWITGRFGSALDFTDVPAPNQSNANGSLVTVPNHAELRLNGPFTVSFWYRPDRDFANSTWPGPMRIGSQSSTSGSNIGWGFYRAGSSEQVSIKRGNAQNSVGAALVPGQWYHIALRYDGAGNNIGYVNGVATSFSQTWVAATATQPFEVGRMDNFDDADVDDVALFDDAVDPARVLSLYTVPTALALDYALGDLRALWAVFDGGPGSSGVVRGTTWNYTTALPGSTTPGDAYLSGLQWYVVLGPGAGVTATATLLGDVSPAAIGVPGTLTFDATPLIGADARFVFDLADATTIGGGINDLIEITGDLNLAANEIVVHPLAPLATGTYRLVNYTGTKTGSFNPVVIHQSRYTLTLDETTPGEINLQVTGSNADLQWTSTVDGTWDFAALNWLNLGTSTADHFADGDTIRLDDSGAFQTNLNLAVAAYPAAMMVESSILDYSLTGSGSLGGLSGGFTKNGTAGLILGTANNFVGAMHVNAGWVRAGASTAFGDSMGATTIADGATLDLNGFNLDEERFIVSGAGVDGTGAIVNSGAQPPNFWGPKWLSLAGDTTINARTGNRWDICRVGGQLVGAGYALTKLGGGTVDIGNAGETDLGDIFLREGNLFLDASTTLGRPANFIALAPGTLLQFWATDFNVLNKVMYMTNATMQSAGGSPVTNAFASPITLFGTNTFDTTANAGLALWYVVGGDGALRKTGPNLLALLGANAYTGHTLVTAGTLALMDSGSIANSAGIALTTGTTLASVTRTDGTLTLAAGQPLSGNGTIAGSLAAAAGASLIPGEANLFGTLTVTNALTLNGGATLALDLSSVTTEGAGANDLIAVGGDLNLSGVTTLRINPIGLLDTANPYTVISYAGTLTGTEANFTVATDSAYVFTVSVATPGKVTVSVTGGGARNLVWDGSAPGSEGVWDLQTTVNWLNLAGPATTFFTGDSVTFDEFGLATTVILVGALNPAAITFENNSVNYTLTGAGKLTGSSSLTKNFEGQVTIENTGLNDYLGVTTITGGTLQVGNGGTAGNLGTGVISNNATLVLDRSDAVVLNNPLAGTGNLVKQNTNVLTLPNANPDYEGTLTANGGTLLPGNAGALGTVTGGTVINAGATLDVNALNLGGEPVTASGAGADGQGAIVNRAGGQNNALRFVTLSGDTTVGGSGRWDIRANPDAALSTGGNGHSLTKVGPNQVSIVSATVDAALGDIHVLEGTLSVEGSTTAGDPARAVTVAQDALLFFYGRSVPWSKAHVLNGGRNIYNANGSTIMEGPVTLNGDVTFDIAGTDLTVNGVIDGPGSLTKIGGSPLTLVGDNTYSGGTVLTAGTVLLGNGGTSGSVVGDIAVNGATLFIHRSDALPLLNNIAGSGNLHLRTSAGLTVDGTAAINLGGNLEVGRDVSAILNILPGASITVGRVNLGNVSGTQGDVYQTGGDVTVTIEARVGHWPNNTSTYLLGGGLLTLTGDPTGVAGNEKPGILYLGVDGTGIFTQTGGVASAHGIVLDNRGDTAGTDTLNLEGGRFTLGPSGIASGGNNANPTYAINLGGGTLASSGSWTSVLNMTLTGTGSDTVFDTDGHSNVLAGALTGLGGLVKNGAGALTLAGASTYSGSTEVNNGILAVSGSMGDGFSPVLVHAGGTLAGNGVIHGTLDVLPGGTVVPGLPDGTLTVDALVVLGGTTVMQVQKTGAVLANTRLTTASLTFGGALTVLVSGDPLAAGDTFDLFDADTFGGTWGTFNLPNPGPGLAWDVSLLDLDGTLSVVSQPRPTMAIALSGSNIELSWPEGFDTFLLQAQTNAPGVGINDTNWITLPAPGTNRLVFPVVTDETIGSVFYRLLQP